MSHACGAVLGAYEQCKHSSSKDDESDNLDMQQAWLRKKVRKEIRKIKKHKEPLQALMLVAYEAVKDPWDILYLYIPRPRPESQLYLQ